MRIPTIVLCCILAAGSLVACRPAATGQELAPTVQPTNTTAPTLPPPADSPTPTLTLTPAPTATPTAAPSPTPEFVGGVLEPNGWVRWTSEMAGVSVALPPDWVCTNRDERIAEKSIARAREALAPGSEDFERKMKVLNEMWGNYRMYCFIPDRDAMDVSRQVELQVDETQQQGFTSAVKLMSKALTQKNCTPTGEVIDGRDAAFSTCSRDFDQVFSILTVYYRYDYILDGGRYIELKFRGPDEALYPLFEEIAQTPRFK